MCMSTSAQQGEIGRVAGLPLPLPLRLYPLTRMRSVLLQATMILGDWSTMPGWVSMLYLHSRGEACSTQCQHTINTAAPTLVWALTLTLTTTQGASCTNTGVGYCVRRRVDSGRLWVLTWQGLT